MALIPFDDRDGKIWMNGEMVDWRDAKVHYLTHSFHYGSLVFEGERAYDGKIFKSFEHSERLKASAEAVWMEYDMDSAELDAIKAEVMKVNNFENAYVRAAAWRGSEQMGIDVTGCKTHIAVAAWEWGSYFKFGDNGISLRSSRWHKPSPDCAPTSSKTASLYNLGSMAKMEAQKHGYNDAFMLDHEGYVAESSGANIFFIMDGALHTPIADRFLNGLTRQTVIDLAKDLGIEVIERRIKPEEIKEVQEVFVTGTAAEVTAVGKIDDIEYQVGNTTLKLQKAYEELVRSAA